MRVLGMLHLYSPHHNAGAETTAHSLLQRLADRGHEVDVQLSREHPKIRTAYSYEGVRVWPYRDQSDPLRWIDTQCPDVVVAHLENTLRASILGDMHNIPVVVLMHNGHGKSMADLRWGTRLVVYNTEWMRTATETWWTDTQGSVPPTGIVVHPPVHRDRYKVVPPPARNGHITLVNLNAEKGAAVFYALAARFPRLKFLGVRGAYGEQQVRDDLPNVTIIPHVPAHAMPSRVYARTRVLLMPSSYESYGRAGVEAACSGIPTIAHPTEGLLEALAVGGTFADIADVDAWTAALAGLTTPKGWAAASARASAVADRLDTVADLNRWATAAESLVGAHAAV